MPDVSAINGLIHGTERQMWKKQDGDHFKSARVCISFSAFVTNDHDTQRRRTVPSTHPDFAF